MIRYFVPADGDDPTHPNVFQLPSGIVGSGSVRFGDVEKNFPLPGRYHFRFKKKFRDAFVWVDMTDAGAMVPSCDGAFTAKITRLSDPMAAAVGGNGMHMGGQRPPPATPQQAVGGSSSGAGLGGDDLLNMGTRTVPPTIPGPGLMGGGSQPDDLLGMGVFDSSPAAGLAPPVAAPPATPAGVGGPRPMPRSPPIHPTPMGSMGGVAGAPASGFATMGGHRPTQPAGMGVQWQQQQHHQHQQQQQQFARFPPQSHGNI